MEQDELLRHTVEILEELQIPYMLVGSLASGVYGEPRLTQDIDIVISPEPAQLDLLSGAFNPDDFYLSKEAAREALRTGGQFNVLDSSSGNKIDFMISRADRWGKMQIARRQRARVLPDREGYVARPEDVIISKMLYYQEGGSEKHLRDITGMLKVSGDKIDRDDIRKWAGELGLVEIWNAILARLKE